jgi:hypothetical protein
MFPSEVRHRKAGEELVSSTDEDESKVKAIVKQLDFNPKWKKKVAKSSPKGGLVSVIALFITLWLIYSEIVDYTTVKTRDVLVVDTDVEKPDELIKVFVEIEFPRLPCAVLSLDAVDGEGEQQSFAKAHIVRSRMKGSETFGHLGQPVLGSEAIPASKWVPPAGYCGSCYDVRHHRIFLSLFFCLTFSFCLLGGEIGASQNFLL